MQLDWLATFVAVVEHGGFTAASTSLFRSQSRVSAHVAALEEELGATLLDRSARPVSLTLAGKYVYQHAKQILDQLDGARRDIAALSGEVQGQVRIGTYASAGAMFLPNVLRQFRDAHPFVNVELVEQAVAGLDSSLVEDEVDLTLRPILPTTKFAGVHFAPLWREPMKLVVSSDHRLARFTSPVPTTALEGERLIIAGHGLPFHTEAYLLLSGRGVSFDVAYISDQPATMVALARAGLGVGFFNVLAFHTTRTEGTVVLDLADDMLVRDVGLFWREEMSRSVAATALHAIILAADVPHGTTSIRNAEPGTILGPSSPPGT